VSDVVVIGGGVAGLTAALELAAGGHGVEVLDAADFGGGTSHGNAGLLCPSYVAPLASPKVLLTALGWLIRGDGPFSLARAPWRPEMARWLARFIAACTRKSEEETRFLAGLARESIDWYDRFAQESADFGLRRNGWLYLYKTAKGFEGGVRHAHAMARAGVAFEILSSKQALDREPGLRAVAGAVRYRDDAHLDPHAFVLAAAERAKAAGVRLRGDCRVSSIRDGGDRVTIATNDGELDASHVVLAAGAATPALAEPLGCRLPVLPGRGHSASLESDYTPTTPLLFAEAHLVVTPMPGFVRMTTGLELGSWDPVPDRTQLDAMARGAGDFLAGPAPSCSDGWVGFRPLTPTGLPIVGPLTRHPRVIVTCGHGTLGMTLAPATARIVRSAVEGRPVPQWVSPGSVGC
jgi:D-amino-acid dehydrogenase